jgi:hypothetical protein
MRSVTFNEFLSYAKQFNGKVLKTNALGKEFEFEIEERGFIYIPLSTGSRRLHGYKFLKRVFDRYLDTNSTRPGDYVDISANASYALTLISKYIIAEQDDFDSNLPLPKVKPVEKTLDIEEGQTGISYEKLFKPYLTDVTSVSLV